MSLFYRGRSEVLKVMDAFSWLRRRISQLSAPPAMLLDFLEAGISFRSAVPGQVPRLILAV